MKNPFNLSDIKRTIFLIVLFISIQTLAFSPLPEVPPLKLFKDFLANVHYISTKEKAFQFLYDEQNSRIAFYHGKTLDSLQAFVNPFIFKMADRLYFQEKLASGFGTAFGYYEKGHGKKYIRTVINTKKITEQGDDQSFYQKWNGNIGEENYFSKPSEINEPAEFNFSKGFQSSKRFEENETRAHQFEFYKTIYPVIRIADENIAFFNFVTDTLELMNKNGKTTIAVPIAFHKMPKARANKSNSIKLSNSDWHWGSEIITDESTREVYTLFLKNGMVKVQRIDLETGKLRSGTVLPFPFPEKIKIFKGDAYFLVKSDGINDNWKLVKCKIS